ncbi:DUF2089 family protein [Alloscardovia macacae]|uniref:DUF2089 domain-containing protein n=1 Tax=Alloscardovia macacae TaxID=1160091 RepID=A0A1Y2SYE9_9BIFI|nr:DUF2089 family protein [Alloscardovia macacae]OTA26827.1 hypothetical protein B9G54_03320 [Alloscardovia macacae]OTA29149.1 hypothetical protein B9T39_04525 [Alloscardovia macacae]OZG54727.1 hypothetical protein ALMA_0052 [Alloscardovia macacae]
MAEIPRWFAVLSEDDHAFIRNFLLSSGSLKTMASLYQVSYPTIRARLDKVREKIQLTDQEHDDDFVLLVKRLAIEEKYDIDTAKVLIDEYRKGQES